jgi:N-acetylglucosamine kinase-like BadF-type ATPase
VTIVVGVDGGGTRTRAIIVDGERELGRGEYSGAVATTHDPAPVADAVAGAVRRAARRAKVTLPVEAMWAGLAGAGSPAARDAVSAALSERGLAACVVVGTDVEAAFQDAFGVGPGVLVIAGTGSIVWARSRSGRVHRVGGWGRHLGDEGSGYALGMAALRRVTRAADGRAPSTELREVLLAALGLGAVEDLVAWVDTASKAAVAALAPLVIRAADRGDAGAQELVADAVTAVRSHVRTALDALAEPGQDAQGLDVILWGGLLAGGGPLRARVEGALAEAGISVRARDLDPPMGAARLALATLAG